MDLSKSHLFAGLANRLQFLAARTNVIAENVANADTPDYVARDLKAPAFGARLAALRFHVADASVLQAVPELAGLGGLYAGNATVIGAEDAMGAVLVFEPLP